VDRETGSGQSHNLTANPDAKVEVEGETVEVVAEEATGEEREHLFAAQARRFPDLVKHARKTDRVIPVIVLTPRESTSEHNTGEQP